MPKSSRPITIKDIAREAKVSIATVSYALRGNSRIRSATRERVEAVAKRLGYIRNPAFAALGAMSHRHASSVDGLPLGFVYELDQYGAGLRVAETVDGMIEGCSRLGYRLEEFVLNDFSTSEHFLKMVVNRGLSGLVIGGVNDPSFFKSTHLERIALVSFSQMD